MQHPLLFNWLPFDALSLGTLSLYRRVMAPSLLKAFDEKPTILKTINDEVEDNLHHVLELGAKRTFDKFDSAFPDLVPPERLHLHGQQVESLADDDDDLEVGDSITFTKISTPKEATTLGIETSQLEAHSCPTKASDKDAAITVASCLPPGASAPHSSNEACSTPARNVAPRKIRTNLVTHKLDAIGEDSEEEEEILPARIAIQELYEEHNDHLRALRADGTNIVLDSPNPHLAPHIVLTPPQHTWHNYTAAFDNRPPEPQFCSPWLLLIPQHQKCWASVSVPSDVDDLEQDEEDKYDEYTPLTVFSHEEFSQFQDQLDDDRLIYGSTRYVDFWHMVNQKQECRTNAFLAAEEAPEFRKYWDRPEFVKKWDRPFKWNDVSGRAFFCARKAPNFRNRWDDPDYASSKEPEFKWDDPAGPILAHYRLSIHRRQTVTIIESDTPCTVPHIVITDPVFNPWDPWAPYNNVPNNPQDYRFGGRMIVPSMETTIINYEQLEYPAGQNSDEDSDSETVSDFPLTPMRTQEELEDDGTVVGVSSLDEERREFAVYLGESTSAEDLSLTATCPGVERSSFDGEEDEWVPWDTGLPPFDDWYTKTA